MRRARVLVAVSTAGLLLAAGCGAAGVAPVADLPVSAPAILNTPEPLAEAIGDDAPDAPMIAGDYVGTMVVTQDTNRVDTQTGEFVDASGTEVEVLLSLLDDCVPGEPCPGEMTSLYFDDLGSDSYWEVEFVAADDTEAVTLVNEDEFLDNCVVDGANGEVVGTFDTTSTVTVVLGDAVDLGDGRMAWSTAEVVYLEDSVGSSDSAGCFTSMYELEGVLERVS